MGLKNVKPCSIDRRIFEMRLDETISYNHTSTKLMQDELILTEAAVKISIWDEGPRRVRNCCGNIITPLLSQNIEMKSNLILRRHNSRTSLDK